MCSVRRREEARLWSKKSGFETRIGKIGEAMGGRFLKGGGGLTPMTGHKYLHSLSYFEWASVNVNKRGTCKTLVSKGGISTS